MHLQLHSSVARAMWLNYIQLSHKCIAELSFITACVLLAAVLVAIIGSRTSYRAQPSYNVPIVTPTLFKDTLADLKKSCINVDLGSMSKSKDRRNRRFPLP